MILSADDVQAIDIFNLQRSRERERVLESRYFQRSMPPVAVRQRARGNPSESFFIGIRSSQQMRPAHIYFILFPFPREIISKQSTCTFLPSIQQKKISIFKNPQCYTDATARISREARPERESSPRRALRYLWDQIEVRPVRAE